MSTTQTTMKRILAALIALVFACGVLAMTGCAEKPEDAAKKALDAELHAFQEGDLPEDFAAETAVGAGVTSDQVQELVTAWTGDFSYEITGATMDGDDICNVEATINSKQLATAMAAMVPELQAWALSNPSVVSDQSAIAAQTVNLMVKHFNQIAPVENKVVVEMKNDGKNWTISDNGMNTLANVIIGDTNQLTSALS